MINFDNAVLAAAVVHHVGNKTNEEPLHLSTQIVQGIDGETQHNLIQYFSGPFVDPAQEFFKFSSALDSPEQNVAYTAAKSCFKDAETFLDFSQTMARFLHEVALHPQIKPGELWIAYLKNIKMDDYLTPISAIAIFKNENQHPFLKFENQQIQLQMGLNPSKVDKGCLIFDLDADDGYQVLICDKSTKAGEAQYWKNSFLALKNRATDFNLTKNFMALTKAYIKDQFSEDFQVENKDKLELLNRSADFFKNNATFSRSEFDEEVLKEKTLIDSFQNFDETYRFNHGIEADMETFNISNDAVKKQIKNFKSVLKLDKNFHVYIHGNRQLIEKGADPDGRKYYKIYYDNEA